MQLLLLLFRAVMSKTTLLLQLMHVGINSVWMNGRIPLQYAVHQLSNLVVLQRVLLLCKQCADCQHAMLQCCSSAYT
jgi:hypothetical protein